MSKIIIIIFFLWLSIIGRAQEFEIVLPEGHNYGITDFSFFDNGRKAISLEVSGQTFVWDIERGQLLAKLVDSNSLGPVFFSPDKKLFFIGQRYKSDTTNLLIFSAKEFRLLHKIKLPKCSGFVFRSLIPDFLNNGSTLILSTSTDNRSFSINIEKLQLIKHSFYYDQMDEINISFLIQDTFYNSQARNIYAYSRNDTIVVNYHEREVYLAKRLMEPVNKLFSKDDKRIYLVYENFIALLDLAKGEYIPSILPEVSGTKIAAVSNDEKMLAILTKNDILQLWDLVTKKKILEKAVSSGITVFKFDMKGKVLFLVRQEYNPENYPPVTNNLQFLNIEKKTMYDINKENNYYLPEIVLVMKDPENPDKALDVAISEFYDNYFDSSENLYVNKIPVDDSLQFVASFNISMDGKIAYIGYAPELVGLSSEEVYKTVSLCKGLFGNQLSYINVGRVLYNINRAYEISHYADPDIISNFSQYFFNSNRLFNFEKRKEIIAVYQIAGSGTIIKTPDNYYMSSGIPRWINFRKNNQLVSFEQLDIRYNRPDKVLKALGNTDTSLIKAYHKAWQKRIKKLDIDTAHFQEGYRVPEADFSNRENISYEQKKEMLTLHIKGADSTFKLDRFNIWVNESPLFGQGGIKIKKRNSNFFDTTITIQLSQEENRIETSVSNVNGTESYRIPLIVNYTPAIRQKEMIRFIGIGIDRFANAKYNLKYSSKDIRDLSVKLKKKYGDDIIIDTLLNESVTVNNIKALKAKLLTTKVNDKVIVSYSGHGMLSKNYDYYLSTYDVNFNHPQENGLAYEELENLLDSIPARKKLMLIDACHSGEVDKEEGIAMNKMADSLGLTKGIILDDSTTATQQLGLKNSFELMQSLFVNVGKSTGATIISAAAGNQFALERGDLKNGVFTYSLLEAMDKNKSIKISELKKIVGERVGQLTNGMQKPTSRNETIAVDWSL